MRKELIAPLTGVAFIVVLVIGFAVAGEPPEAKDSTGQEIIQHYIDNKGSTIAGVILSGFAAALLVFFGGHLRRVFSAAEGRNGMFSAVVFAGTIIVATGAAIDATISLALAESAKNIEPAAAQALEAIWDNDFIPIAVGTEIFLFAAGLTVIMHRPLPVWLGWIAIVLGILGGTPAGFIAFIGAGLWILVVSIILTMQARNGAGAAPAPATP